MRLYSEATATLSHRVQALADAPRSAPLDVFDRAWEDCEASRMHCSHIQELLYAHLREHRCGDVVESTVSSPAGRYPLP